MSDNLTIQGARQVQEDESSPRFRFGKDKHTCTRTFRCADYATLEAAVPEYDATMADVESAFPNCRTVSPNMAAGFAVTDRDLQPEKGGKGTLTITFERAARQIAGSSEDKSSGDSGKSSEAKSSDDTPPAQSGCDWVEVARAVELNNHFTEIVNDEKVLSMVEDALNERNRTKRNQLVADLTAESALGLELYKKKLKGTTHYKDFAPVAELTTYSDDDPGLGGAGFIDDPPAECGAPLSYFYLKSADKKHFDGTRWQRTQQWTGALEIDTDLYST